MPNKFVAIRMIVLDYDRGLADLELPGLSDDASNRRAIRDDFKNWMTSSIGSAGEPAFLDIMGGLFGPDLEGIWFLEGNKVERDGIDATGDFVPIGTFVTPLDRPVQSYRNAHPSPLVHVPRLQSTEAGANADFAWITYWKDRTKNRNAWRQPRPPEWVTPGGRNGTGLWNKFLKKCLPRPGRPLHGPAYDDKGGSPPYGDPPQYGAGAGCLVEGFQLVYPEDMGNPQATWQVPEDWPSS